MMLFKYIKLFQVEPSTFYFVTVSLQVIKVKTTNKNIMAVKKFNLRNYSKAAKKENLFRMTNTCKFLSGMTLIL